jgi:hypothetical protein
VPNPALCSGPFSSTREADGPGQGVEDSCSRQANRDGRNGRAAAVIEPAIRAKSRRQRPLARQAQASERIAAATEELASGLAEAAAAAEELRRAMEQIASGADEAAVHPASS